MPRLNQKPAKRGQRKQSTEVSNTSVPTSPYDELSNLTERVHGKQTIAGRQQYERIQKISAELFATRGYRSVGVAEICEAVGLGRGALYYHISSKEDLLFGIAVHYVEDLVTHGRQSLETQPDPRKRIHFLSRYLMQPIFANLPEMTVCFREADCLTGQRHRIVAELHQAYQDVWTATLRDGEKKGIFKPLPTVAIKGILGMYFYSFLWLKPGGKRTSGEIADIFAEMTLSIAKATSRKPAI